MGDRRAGHGGRRDCGQRGRDGRDIAADLWSATILNPADEVMEWPQSILGFEYRSSRLKRAHGKLLDAASGTPYVVLAATFQMAVAKPAELEKKAQEFNEYRRRTQPPGASMGSMFKIRRTIQRAVDRRVRPEGHTHRRSGDFNCTRQLLCERRAGYDQ